MARPSPLIDRHRQAEALTVHYGPAEAGVEVVQTFGEVELEYAAIRRGCGLIDLPQRATIETTGPDRVDFLNRMLTQELKGFAPWTVRSAFWLSRKGRIDADLRLVQVPERVLIDVDVHALDRAIKGLGGYVISEDCNFFDRTNEFHRLGLHGPAARAVLGAASEPVDGPGVASIEPGQACSVRIGGHVCVADRLDSLGEVGLELLVPTAGVGEVYDRLLDVGGFDRLNNHGPGAALEPGRTRGLGCRPIGWAAYNIARVEAGTPVYYLDFGPDSLPAETGVLNSRVSFTKGCYLGQEIVARMHALGSPKQVLVSIKGPAPKLPTSADPTQPAPILAVPQPVTGAAIFLAPEGDGPSRPSELGEPIGAVTSSAVSPMLSQTPVMLAMVKFKHAAPGTRLMIECEGTLVPGSIQPSLRAWARPAAGG
jgi:folate-binding protein YgfZ